MEVESVSRGFTQAVCDITEPLVRQKDSKYEDKSYYEALINVQNLQRNDIQQVIRESRI